MTPEDRDEFLHDEDEVAVGVLAQIVGTLFQSFLSQCLLNFLEFQSQFLAGLLQLSDLLLQVGDLFLSSPLLFGQRAELIENVVVPLGSFLLSSWLSAVESLQRFEKSSLFLIFLLGLLLVFFEEVEITDAGVFGEVSQAASNGNLIDLLRVLGEVEGRRLRV